MSNPERRVQVRIGDRTAHSTAPLSAADAAVLQGETPLDPTDAFPGSKDDDVPATTWEDLKIGWNVPTVTTETTAPSVGVDTHDSAAMLESAQAVLKDPRLADKVAGQVYAGEEAAGRAAQVGDRVDLENDEPDEAPISLPGEPEAGEDFADAVTDQVPHPSFGTGDSLVQMTDAPFPLENYVQPSTARGKTPWDSAVDHFGEEVFPPREPQPVVIERSSSKSLSMPEPTTVQGPVVSGSIGDAANMTQPSIAPRGEALAIANAPETQRSNSWFGRTIKAVVDTVKRLAIIGSLFAQPEPQKPITVPQPAPPVPEQVIPAPQPVQPPANLPVAPAPDRLAQTTTIPSVPVNDSAPAKPPVRLVDSRRQQRLSETNEPPKKPTDTKGEYRNTTADGDVYYSDKPIVPSTVNLDYPAPQAAPVAPSVPTPAAVTAEPIPTPPPAPVVDLQQPARTGSIPTVETPSTPAEEVSKAANFDTAKMLKNPDALIGYITSSFDKTDGSKIFFRLSPTKRIEVLRQPNGELMVKLPGKLQREPLTAEIVAGFGKDLSKVPYTTPSR